MFFSCFCGLCVCAFLFVVVFFGCCFFNNKQNILLFI